MGARAMLELAESAARAPVPVKAIAGKQGLSPKYLEQIMGALRSAGLLRGARGVHGGYTLALPPEDITLADIVRVFEGTLSAVECLDDPDLCANTQICPAREVWMAASSAVTEILEATTLRDLQERRRAKKTSRADMYNI